jgi:hypothetical protein
VQNAKGACPSLTFAQFSHLVRLPIPTNLDQTGALQTDLLVKTFIHKVRARIRQGKEAKAADAQVGLD